MNCKTGLSTLEYIDVYDADVNYKHWRNYTSGINPLSAH